MAKKKATPYTDNPAYRYLADALDSDIKALRTADTTHVYRVKRGLNDLIHHVPSKHRLAMMTVLFEINKTLKGRGRDPAVCAARKHVLSDHALLRTLERYYRIDVAALRDRALQDLEKSDFDIVRQNGIVVTILEPLMTRTR